jgi:type II secretory pathway pseudopilin PulG
MLEQLGRIPWRKQIRFYGVLIGVCLVLAAGINTLMDQARQDGEESEALRSLRSQVEQYRKAHGDKANREELVSLWKSYEGKLSPKELEKLKQEYRAKLHPDEVEGLKKAFEGMKDRKP